MMPNMAPNSDRTHRRTATGPADRTRTGPGPDAFVPLAEAAQRLGITYDAGALAAVRCRPRSAAIAGMWLWKLSTADRTLIRTLDWMLDRMRPDPHRTR